MIPNFIIHSILINFLYRKKNLFFLILLTACQEVDITPPPQPFVFKTFGFETIKDIDGNTYKTIPIGKNIWMAENLKTTRFSNGKIIPNDSSTISWKNDTTSALCSYNNDTEPINIYGRLYNYLAVADTSKLCPTGWHLPSADEWNDLLKQAGPQPAVILKEETQKHWLDPYNEGTNNLGFSALPGGYRNSNGYFEYVRKMGYFWSNTYDSVSNSKYPRAKCLIIYDDTTSYIDSESIKSGLSVRCVKDE